jgi:hypothetical protein
MNADSPSCDSQATTYPLRVLPTPTSCNLYFGFYPFLSFCVLIICFLFVFTNKRCTMKIGWGSRQPKLSHIPWVHSFPYPNVNQLSILPSYLPFLLLKIPTYDLNLNNLCPYSYIMCAINFVNSGKFMTFKSILKWSSLYKPLISLMKSWTHISYTTLFDFAKQGENMCTLHYRGVVLI